MMDNLQFPANVMAINEVLIEISNFEAIDSGKINDMFLIIPEEDPFSLNFQECGVDS